MLSSTALKSVLAELGPQFEKATGHKVAAQFAPAAELKARIDKGEAFDVAILTTPLMDDLAKQQPHRGGLAHRRREGGRRRRHPQGRAQARHRHRGVLQARDARIEVGGLCRHGRDRRQHARRLRAPRHRRRDEGEDQAALRHRRGRRDRERRGRARLHPGQRDPGVAGAELAGPLPPELQVYTVFPAAGSASAREPEAALQFLRYLKTPEAAKVIRAKGMEPG